MQLEQLWNEYRAALQAFLHSKIANHADVDDVLQDILIKTHKNMGQIRSADSVKSWLFQVANTTIIDFYRRRGRHRELSQDDLWFSEEEADIKTELSHCIDPFIGSLPEASAELLTAVDINGELQKEYAASLGISYSTLKSRVQKARRELRGLFDDCCHMHLDNQGNLMDYDYKEKGCETCMDNASSRH